MLTFTKIYKTVHSELSRAICQRKKWQKGACFCHVAAKDVEDEEKIQANEKNSSKRKCYQQFYEQVGYDSNYFSIIINNLETLDE